MNKANSVSKFVNLLGNAPTEDAITSAKLHLEHFGGNVCRLLDTNPVDPGKYAEEQSVHPMLVDFFKAEGWEHAGSGWFSSVFTKGGLALKVGLKTEDSAATYAAWCRANQGRPGVPVIHAIEKFSDCYVVLTEQCFPLHHNSFVLNDPVIRSECAVLHDVIKGGEPMSGFPTSFTAKSIRSFFTGIATFDLTRKNLMLDRRGEVTITDPVSFDHNGSGYTYTDYITA